jgi:hypothetical protein
MLLQYKDKEKFTWAKNTYLEAHDNEIQKKKFGKLDFIDYDGIVANIF